MLLRTRLTLILSLAFLVVVALLVFAGSRREQLMDERFAEVAIAGQLSLWAQLVEEQAAELQDAGEALVAAPEFANALGATALRIAAQRVAGALVASDQADLIQLVQPDGLLLYSSEPRAEERPMLDAGSLDRLMADGGSIAGVRQDRPDRYVILVALPIVAQGRTTAVAILAIDAIKVLRRFSAAFGAPSYLISLRGRLVRATDDGVWQLANNPEVPPREPSFGVAEGEGRLYSVTGVPIPDFSGGTAGTLVTLRDSTQSLAAMRDLASTALLLVGGLVLAILTGLYLYLKRGFRPLEGAISVLRALSQGNTKVRLEESGSGEIRRIADAVAVFRRNAVQLEEHRQHQARLRSRQERLIRRQMERLAQTLEDDGRAQVMEDLKEIVQRKIESAGAVASEVEQQDEQLGMLAALLQRMSARIADQHHRLTELVAELREAIVTRAKLAGLQQELEIAKQLQYSILPRPLPPRDDVDVHGIMLPAKEVGGDFYDFFFLDDTRLAVVVADVSGKGVPAALFMAITRTLLKATTLFTPSPAACLERLNAFLAAENDQMMFVTLLYGVLDLRNGRFSYACAGHNPALLRHSDGRVIALPTTGDVALAVVEDAAYHERTAQMQPGDALLLYTDGITEAFNPEGELYGDDRLAAAWSNAPVAAGPATAAGALVEAVHAFERGHPQTDDVTCVVLKLLKLAN